MPYFSNATKNRYPSAKTRLQPISIARNKQRSTAITSIYNTSHVIHPSVTTQAMAHNPMVVRKLFPETQMTTDRIMTPPISLGGGGYRYNQLPPIDPTQESDFHHQAATLNHTSIGKGLKGAVNSGISKNGVNSRVFSARTDEVGVKRAVKNFALQKENYFLDYSRPSTTAEIRVSCINYWPRLNFRLFGMARTFRFPESEAKKHLRHLGIFVNSRTHLSRLL